MITLKLRGKHCPVNFTGRTRIEAKRVIGGLLEYELNPDMLTDLFDELCDLILKMDIENRRMETELCVYKRKTHDDDDRVKLGGGYGD